MTDSDDDIEEYLDPELDSAVMSGGDSDSSLSAGTSIASFLFLSAVLALALSGNAVLDGAYDEAGFYSMLAGLLVVTGALARRFTNQD